jgi:phosphatidylserine/phosphatidylglycerophosphate/cardiolipin synthase-like enzyme
VRLPSSLQFRLAAAFLLGLLLVLGFTLRHASTPVWQASTALLQPLPQDPLIQVYFNHSQAAIYTEPYRQQQRLGDDLEQMVVETIATAQSSIDVAVHELNLPRIAEALQKRHQAGVEVRVIMDNHYSRPLSSMTRQQVARLKDRERKKYQEFVRLVDRDQDGQLSPTEIAQGDALVMLNNAKIPYIDDTADGSKGSGLMHHKFLVIDQRIVIAGSANLTLSDVHGDMLSPASQGNANHLLKITSPALAKIFTQEFNFMWGDGSDRSNRKFGLKKPHRRPQTVALAPGSTVTVQFSPTSTRLSWAESVNGLIGRALNTATRTIDLALFVFSDQNLSNFLETLHHRGVQIRTLIEPEFAYRDYNLV